MGEAVAIKAIAGDPPSPRASREHPREVPHKLRPKGHREVRLVKVVVVGWVWGWGRQFWLNGIVERRLGDERQHATAAQ